MRIYFDNVDFGASNGPNNYAQKLAHKLTLLGHEIVGLNDEPDAQISFIQVVNKVAPMLLRLDGIYFNSDQDWRAQNAPIKLSYDEADAVVVQSTYNQSLIEHHFGRHDNIHIIHNGTCHDIIKQIEPIDIKATIPELARYEEFWMCAAHWRPHKRLEDNVRYFEAYAPENAAMLVFGKADDQDIVSRVAKIASGRVVYVGEQPWSVLIGAMKACSTFVHLAWLDHCPNVVVDALACGCHLVCSTAGGTNELPVDLPWCESWTEIQDEETFGPCKLYEPPVLDMNGGRNQRRNPFIAVDSIDEKMMRDAHNYVSVLENMLQHTVSQ